MEAVVQHKSTHFAIANSITTGRYLQITSPCIDKCIMNERIRVLLPDRKIIASILAAHLDTSHFLSNARKWLFQR